MDDPIDTVIHEATYGDRTHRERSEARDELTQIITEALRDKKKAVIIPCFALERSQALLHMLIEIRDLHGLDFILGLDSPLASHYTEIAGECTEDELFRESLSGKKFRDDIERDGLHK